MWSTVSARSGALRKAVHGTGPLPKLQVDALLSPVGCEIEPRPIISTKCPVCGALLDMRDLAQMLAHVHDAEIEICEGPGPQGPLH
jgi:hypothetical protein